MARSTVLAEAVRLFSLRGVDGVSIADIADAAQMSKANVLHHFGSKDQLYRACLERSGAGIEAAVELAHERIVDGVDPITAIRTEVDRWAAAHPDDVRLMAYGLLRLRERPGPWVLERAVTSMMRAAGIGPARAIDEMAELLGPPTYRVMAAPLAPVLQAAVREAGAVDEVTA